jgi:hypothetical protein
MIDAQLMNNAHLEKSDGDLSPDEEIDENAKIFPQRLMEILTEPTNADAITWLPHGKAFIIINRQKFANMVLPKYFRKTKYTSFTRKLNRWNFTRVTRGPELGAYYHEFFQRNSESLCTQMYCKNERAKFAVSKDPSKDTDKSDSESSVSSKETKPTTETKKSNMPATELLHMSGMFPKPLGPSIDPTHQTRAALMGQQPFTQTMLHHTFQSPMMSPESALLRMQQLAAMQQQLQLQQQQLAPNRNLYNNYRASAA